MAKVLKQMLAAQLEAALGEGADLLLIDTGPMPVEVNREFRADLRSRAGGARMRVIHNRTARVALGAIGVADPNERLRGLLKGPSAVLFGGDGPISIAKVVREWVRRHKTLTIKGAVADGELLGPADAAGLADLPDLTQLKGMLAGVIQGPARGLAASLQAVYGGLARALQARVDKEGGGDAAA